MTPNPPRRERRRADVRAGQRGLGLASRIASSPDGAGEGQGGEPAVFDLTHFTLSDMTVCGAALRGCGGGAASLEEVAGRLVAYLRDRLRDGADGPPACPLVRLFKTHPFGALDPVLRQAARAGLEGAEPPPGLKCLVLLGTAGDRPEWNSRLRSAGHRALPLAGALALSRWPMLAQLVRELGVEPDLLVRPDPARVAEYEGRKFNVFHVAEAAGSPHVPAQAEFVRPCGIRSVLGFGGALPGAEVFVVLLFSRVAIPRETADLFRVLALSAKLSLLPLARGRVFAAAPPREGDASRQRAGELLPA